MVVAWHAWSGEPTVLIGIVMAAWAYMRGQRRLGHGAATMRQREGTTAPVRVAYRPAPITAIGKED